MAETEHTRGPWRASPTAGDAVIADTCPESCKRYYQRDDGFNLRAYGGYVIAESIAPENKPVIIAAPDLLAACEAALKDGILGDGTATEMVRQAIAKARGQVDGGKSCLSI